MFGLFSHASEILILKTKILNPDDVEESVFWLQTNPSSFYQGCYVIESLCGENETGKTYRYTLYDTKDREVSDPKHRTLGIIDYTLLHPQDGALGHIDVSCEGKWNPYLNILFLEKTTDKNYKHVGTALHEVAFRASIKLGKNGMVSLDVGYRSLLFHYGCGFRVCERYFGKDDVIPARSFDWDELDDEFKANSKLGIDACLASTLKVSQIEISFRSATEKEALLSKISFNDVLAFYSRQFKAGDNETKDLIRCQLTSQNGTVLVLNEQTIAAKKIEFQISGDVDKCGCELMSPS